MNPQRSLRRSNLLLSLSFSQLSRLSPTPRSLSLSSFHVRGSGELVQRALTRKLSQTSPWEKRLASTREHGEFNHDLSSQQLSGQQLQEPEGSDEGSYPSHGAAAVENLIRYLASDPVYLRDSCQCTQCVNPSTLQRKFSTAHISSKIQAIYAGMTPTGEARVEWKNDISGFGPDHVSMFTEQDLIRLKEPPKPSPTTRTRLLWDAATIQRRVGWVEYEKYMHEPSPFKEAISALHRDGLLFLRNVPDDIDAVVKIAERIGPLRNTFYGSTWNVRSVANAKNVAYTNDDLRFHMDMLYLSNPPGYQFLHFISNSCHGGESQFVDTFHAAQRLRRTSKDTYDYLCSYPMEWSYQNDGQHYRQARPTFQEARRPDGAIEIEQGDTDEKETRVQLAYVNWSPPFQGQLHRDENDPSHSQRLVDALGEFDRILNGDDMVFELKVGEGTCVIFENRRIAHARKGFVMESGERLLRGAYVDEDAFWSKLRATGADQPDITRPLEPA